MMRIMQATKQMPGRRMDPRAVEVGY